MVCFNDRFNRVRQTVGPYQSLGKIALIFMLACLNAGAVAETGHNAHIHEAWPVELDIQLSANPSTSDSSTSDSSKADEAGMRISFTAFGQNFDLVLNENKSLMKNHSSRLLNVELFAGKMEGVADSWARITKVDGQVTGAIYDGNDLYLLDSGSEIAKSVDGSMRAAMQGTKTGIYRASDVVNDATCGAHTNSKFSYDKLISELRGRRAEQRGATGSSNAIALEAEGATEQVNLVIVADTQYVASSTSGTEAQVLSQMNIVDGIFSQQVGVQFGITEIRALNTNGPLTSTNPSTLLNQFSSLIRNDNPGLAHLFSGRNLNGNVIGIAFLRGICRATTGVGVTQAGGRGTIGALTAAHEFGHNFGAPHDNQSGSACVSTAGSFLMNPSINGSDEFSQCSLGQINANLARVSCLVDVNEPPPNPEPIGACEFSSPASEFAFIDDPQTPAYTSSSFSGGVTNIAVGGVDNADISNMQGTLRRQCIADAAGNATITVTASLSQSSDYESNEFSQLGVSVNGNPTVFETITGDGNGGASQTTGTQTFTTTVSLSAGTNTLDLSCFNNLKTFNNEITDCTFDNISLTSGGTDGGASLDEDFGNDLGGFSFQDDASDPAYAAGSRAASGGTGNSAALTIILGGVDNADISDMQSNWTRSFSAPGGPLILTLNANLTQTPSYEANEFSEIGVVIDGNLEILNRVTGNGNGGGNVSTGLQRYTLPLSLTAGQHSIGLYCLNNLKTFNNESTTCLFDDVLIQ